MTPLFSSRRHFKVWRYVVSHGQLLFRSVPTEATPSRQEVLFTGVYALKISTEMDTFLIREATPEEVGDINREIGTAVADLGLRAFVVTSSLLTGYVIAAAFNFVEDEGDYKTPSSLFIGS